MFSHMSALQIYTSTRGQHSTVTSAHPCQHYIDMSASPLNIGWQVTEGPKLHDLNFEKWGTKFKQLKIRGPKLSKLYTKGTKNTIKPLIFLFFCSGN